MPSFSTREAAEIYLHPVPFSEALSHVLDGPLRQAHGAIGLPNSDVPDTFMNIELHRALISHFQQQRLALVLALDVDALHDVESG